MRFAGRTLFCTGGGSGIGAAVCRRYAAEGGNVAVVDVDGTKAAEVVASIEGAISFGIDISDEAAVRDAVAATVERFGGISGVYNGAGNLTVGPTEGFEARDFMRMLEVHALGSFLVCREAIPALRASGHGAIVNTSSVIALVARASLGPYSAAKGAVHAYTRQLAIELAPEIRVNSVAPGRTLTGMTEWIYRDLGGGDLEAGLALAGEEVMLGRVAMPEELAASICFLLSDDASYVTGHCLVVDGGFTAD
ncbi:MAG: SDR family oxidoreductase [Actinobacteria bacterium]|nr:SDR family oxidoreductase [Actinomycetota bacterium]